MKDGARVEIGDPEVDYVVFPVANLKVDPRLGVVETSERSDSYGGIIG